MAAADAAAAAGSSRVAAGSAEAALLPAERPADRVLEAPTMPSADGLETGEAGLTGPFAHADANRYNMQAATAGVEIMRRQEGSCRTVAARRGKRRRRAARRCPVSSRLGRPRKLGGVYNATVLGTGAMAEEA